MNRRKILFVLGLFALISSFAYAAPLQEQNSIRLMSYNVRNARGLDNVTDYQRVADVINSVKPDILAVQELDSVTGRSNDVNVLDELSRRTLMFPTYAPAIDYDGGKYGLGVLSKERPLSVKRVPLPGREEARMLLIVELEGYYFGCTHLSLNKEDRLRSVDIIKREAEKLDKPFFLAGDMNSKPDSPEQIALNDVFTSLLSPQTNTYPADEPNVCIDYIYGYKGMENWSRLTNRGVIEEKVASDHRPLYVEVRLHADEDKIFRTKPYLQRPIDGGITISWLTNVPVHSWVEYGIDGKLDQQLHIYLDGQMLCNNYLHTFRLENLIPGQTYSYRVCSREIAVYEAYRKEFGKTSVSETYTFRLPTEKDTDFTAVILNDLHQRKGLVDLISEVIKDVGYDFVVFNGDNIDDPRNEAQAVNSMSYMNEKVGAESTPVFYLRGNHEIRGAYSIGLRDLLEYMGEKTYGAFNWGDTRFVILDCGEDKDDGHREYFGLNDFTGLRKEQGAFLRKELSSKDFNKAKKKVLIHHIPIYGLGEGAYNPSFDEWGDILKNAPFDVALNGHTHRFAHHPKKSIGNNFPVVIGGGNNPKDATIMILKKKGSAMTLQVLDVNGDEKLKLEL
ncbi:MAG: endonuclease/exonuclease/phosphatase family protein [Fermentimonas sp.]